MTRPQLNSQSMGSSVAQNLQNNAPLCAGKTEVLASVALHNQNMTVIKDLAVLQLNAKEITGLVRDKNLLRALMIFNSTRIVAGITAYANKNGDNQLAKSIAFTPTTMKRANDNALLAIFQKVSVVANANAAAIIPFGVDAAMISLLDGDIISFNSIIQKPKEMHASQRNITADLAKAFTTMKTHLKTQMDKLMHSFFLDTTFEKTYFLARKIYNIGTPSTIFRGNVTNEQGHPVKNCLVELINYPSPGVTTKRITNGKGDFDFKRLTADTVTARFRAVNYAVSEFDVRLTKDHETTFSTVLIPVPVPVSVPA